MSLPLVLPVAGGLTVARRAGAPAHGTALHVAGVAPVPRPDAAPLDAYNVDAQLWRRSWSSAAGLVVEFLGLAMVEVRPDGAVFFDRRLDTQTEEHLLLDHVLPLVLADRGSTVLHGAVLSREEGAVVLVGSSGVGKSTLSAFCWQKGWTLGGDDGAVLEAGPPVLAEPTYATVRVTAATAKLLDLPPPAAEAQILGKWRISGPVDRPFQQQAVPLRTIALLVAVPMGSEATFEDLRGVDAHAELFGSTFHVDFSGGPRMRQVVDVLGHVVDHVRVGRLHVPRGLPGLHRAEHLLRDLVDR